MVKTALKHAGHRTFTAGMDFQKAHGLVPDGEVGPQTARALGIMLQ
jgi:peptidoglycan hydrolase-like protein with peptidoglycan-binding domain